MSFCCFHPQLQKKKKLPESKTLNSFFYAQNSKFFNRNVPPLPSGISTGEDKSNVIVTDFVCVSVVFPLQLECLEFVQNF